MQLKIFRQQNGLVDSTEVPLPFGLSWVTKIKTDIKKSYFKSYILSDRFSPSNILFAKQPFILKYDVIF